VILSNQNKESTMSRPTAFCAAILMFSAIATVAQAQETKVRITVERSKPAGDVARAPFDGRRPTVDLAILLDTSNSMDGLINQAKSQIWSIIQQFANAKKNGHTPSLRVALFEYGNTRLPAAEGYIRQVIPLTDDLDKLSESLFALTTQGGDEYCGQVINEAVTRLDWSNEPKGYKAIFICGNEPFTQGPVDYRAACRRAIEHGIIVNTIHCGTSSEGIAGKWQDGARLAEGEFFNIDQDRAVVQIKCPQDEIIIKLNAELNQTYLWYGARNDRNRYAENQLAQDSNAAKAGLGSAVGRGAAKAGGAYDNRSRDLVDALNEDGEALKKVQKDDLPDALKDMSPDERTAYVEKVAARRADVQKKINALAAERESYLAAERKRPANGSADSTLAGAVVKTIQKQLANSGFETARSPE
jgi:von Willebrand factor type A domain